MGCPAQDDRAARQAPRARRAPARRPASFFGVPLCICQYAGTFTPQGWCFAWTAGIEPATTGFGDQRSPWLSYVHMLDVNENRPPGMSPASGFRPVLAPLSRSHLSDQGSTQQQGRGYADIPLVPLALVA